MARPTIDLPPFPGLEWDEFSWMGKIVLPSWAGFQVREDASESVGLDSDSDVRPWLYVHPKNHQAKTPPLPEQAEAFRFLLEHEEAVARSVLQAIFVKYLEWRGLALDDDFRDDEEEDDLMPEIERPEQLRSLIGLSNVHVLNVAKDGVAYTGFEFGCTWDEEHGLGVMTHRGRIIEVGGADTSFLEWIAERDARDSR